MRRASSEAQDASISSLRSLTVHRLEPGHYIAPLLCSDTLPFAVGLELFVGNSCKSESDAFLCDIDEVEADDGMLCLQYILDGRGQVRNCSLLVFWCSTTGYCVSSSAVKTHSSRPDVTGLISVRFSDIFNRLCSKALGIQSWQATVFSAQARLQQSSCLSAALKCFPQVPHLLRRLLASLTASSLETLEAQLAAPITMMQRQALLWEASRRDHNWTESMQPAASQQVSQQPCGRAAKAPAVAMQGAASKMRSGTLSH